MLSLPVMVSDTLCAALHILRTWNVYSRAKGTTDHYWPRPVFFPYLNQSRAADPKGTKRSGWIHSENTWKLMMKTNLKMLWKRWWVLLQLCQGNVVFTMNIQPKKLLEFWKTRISNNFLKYSLMNFKTYQWITKFCREYNIFLSSRGEKEDQHMKLLEIGLY